MNSNWGTLVTAVAGTYSNVYVPKLSLEKKKKKPACTIGRYWKL